VIVLVDTSGQKKPLTLEQQRNARGRAAYKKLGKSVARTVKTGAKSVKKAVTVQPGDSKKKAFAKQGLVGLAKQRRDRRGRFA
jgi:hypothetical protein